jgi:hypothetical protein
MTRFTCSILMLAGIVASGCVPPRAAQPAPAPVFLVAVGTWAWERGGDGCERDPHTITFSPDWSLMFLRTREPLDPVTGRREAVYEVRGHGPNYIRAFMRDEDRRDERGELVEWDLVLLSPDRYVWRRSDWKRTSSTAPVERCPAVSGAVPA